MVDIGGNSDSESGETSVVPKCTRILVSMPCWYTTCTMSPVGVMISNIINGKISK